MIIGKKSEHLGKKSEFEKVLNIDIMTDVFRKRPILGNRILVPIREKKAELNHRLISHKEAHQVCREWVRRDLLVRSYDCDSIELTDHRNGIDYHYTMWKCSCKEWTLEILLKEIKEIAFNW